MLLFLLVAGQLDLRQFEKDLAALEKGVSARVGVCVQDSRGIACNRADERFSLQSVMKMHVGLAALEAADRGKWSVETKLHVTRKDLSAFVQPIEKRIGPQGAEISVGDFIRSAIIESDSAAADILLDRLGGPAAVNALLRKWRIQDMRLDRNERDLQAESHGLTWKTEYGEVAAFRAAIARVPPAQRRDAYEKYRKDPRDTSTPRAMANLLRGIADGKLLSPASHAFLKQAMLDTATGLDRLKAGLSQGWKLEHKTGTASTWEGLTAATNDVGILTAPAGERIAIAVFIGDSKSADAGNAKAIAGAARAVIKNYR
jgi:beta-lactamase class A